MRRLLTTSATLLVIGGVATTDAAAQAPMANLGVDYTAAFTGDDFEGLEGGIGFHGGLLFPLGPASYIGADLGWTGVDFEGASDAADASILDVMGVVQVGVASGRGEPGGFRPYVDLRAGYSRMSFEFSEVDGNISGPVAGGGLGARFGAGGVMVDVHGLYQHMWYGEFDDEEDLIFETESSGGRVALGAGISIPFGGN